MEVLGENLDCSLWDAANCYFWPGKLQLTVGRLFQEILRCLASGYSIRQIFCLWWAMTFTDPEISAKSSSSHFPLEKVGLRCIFCMSPDDLTISSWRFPILSNKQSWCFKEVRGSILIMDVSSTPRNVGWGLFFRTSAVGHGWAWFR